MNRYLRLLLV